MVKDSDHNIKENNNIFPWNVSIGIFFISNFQMMAHCTEVCILFPAALLLPALSVQLTLGFMYKATPIIFCPILESEGQRK